jgi:hypothetical protein
MEPRLLVSAQMAGITRLYHYERFKEEYLSTVLREHKVHCSSPPNLNDPWDCKPWFNSHSLEDPETLEAAIESFYRHAGDDLQYNLKALWEDRLRNSHEERVNFIERASRLNIEIISGRRIYCLTPHPDSTLMWSHYAENHRGICLEFTTDNPLFGSALAVIYRSDYPEWTLHEFESPQRRAIEMLLTKAEDWRYEDEYRIVGVQFANNAGYLHPEGDYFRLPPGALKSVIAGCEADYAAIATVVQEHVPDLPVKRAVRVPDRYSITIT